VLEGGGGERGGVGVCRAGERRRVVWLFGAVVQIWSGVKVFSAVSKGVGRGCEAALQTDLSVGGGGWSELNCPTRTRHLRMKQTRCEEGGNITIR